MKAYIGADLESGAVHTVVATTAKVHDVTQAHKLLHGQEKYALGDAGYQGVEKRPEMRAAHPKVIWEIAMRLGKRRALDKASALGQGKEGLEQVKASFRAQVEHPFRVIKRQFGFVKTRYRGLAKNLDHLHTLFALSNLWLLHRHLLAATG